MIKLSFFNTSTPAPENKQNLAPPHSQSSTQGQGGILKSSDDQ